MTPTPATPATPSAATPPVTQAPAVDAAALQREIDVLKSQVGEHQRTAEFWHGKATARDGAPKPAAPAEPEEEEDILDLITTRGAKGLDALLKKRGFVSATEVDARVDSKARQLTKEAQLVDQYPDLKKKDSEFFKLTAQHYGTLKGAGMAEDLAMETAAEKAELQLLREGKLKTAPQRAEEATREADRLARISAQGGERNGRGGDPGEGDDELTPEQRTAAIRLLAGNGVTEEQAIEKYKARAKKGIVMRSK